MSSRLFRAGKGEGSEKRLWRPTSVTLLPVQWPTAKEQPSPLTSNENPLAIFPTARYYNLLAPINEGEQRLVYPFVIKDKHGIVQCAM